MNSLRRAHGARILLILPFLVALLACFPLALRAESVASLPQPTDYVSDFAHVLSPDAVARIDSLCAQLDHSAANAELAVVTVHDLDGDDAADYANQLEDHWKMGNKGENRYAMVLLAVADRKYRIEVGYGLEGILNDAKVGDIGRTMVPDLRVGDYDGAIMLAVGQVAQDIAADANVTLNQNLPVAPAVSQPVEEHGSALGKLILLILVLVFFGGFSLLRMLFGFGLFFGGWGGGGWRGGGWGGGGSGGGGLGGGWGGGGFGGGGGGGGGFGGFGGAGGGFGGGGAGGSW
jgi:uncharacterized protein